MNGRSRGDAVSSLSGAVYPMGDILPGTANALAGRMFPHQLVNAYNASIKKAFLFQGKPFAELKILP
jgi:hypothetical protein